MRSNKLRIAIGARRLALIAVLVTLGSAAHAQFDQPGLGLQGFGDASDDQRVTIAAEILPPAANRPATLQISATIQPGWKVYSITQKKGGPKTTIIDLDASQDFSLAGDFQTSPAPKIHQEPFWPGLDIEEHYDQVTWSVPLGVAMGTDLANLVVRGTVRPQACSDSTCVDLKLPFEARLAVGDAAQPPPRTTPPQKTAQTNPPRAIAPITAPDGPSEFRSPNVMAIAEMDHAEVQPGEQFNLLLTLSPSPGWHVYERLNGLPEDKFASRPTLIALAPSSSFVAGSPTSSLPVTEKRPEYSDTKQRYYEGPVTFSVPITAAQEPGMHMLEGYIGYQACSDAGMCTIPTAARFQVVVPVGVAAAPGAGQFSFAEVSYTELGQLAAATATTAVADETSASNVRKTAKVLFFAFIAGLILNVMPCVLPVIGLKLMSFVQQAGEERGRIFQLNLAYVLGIMSVFMALAALAAFANLGWGQQFQTPEVAIALAAVVFVFALSLLGVWEIPVPGFVGTGAAAEVAEREGMAGAYCKGILTTILATPCSGPFLGTALAWAMAQQKAIIFATFASMGLGMASPYLVLSIFPQFVRFLPKPGNWMETFKELMGFVLLGTVVWIFTIIKEEYRVASLSLLVGLWFACWLFGRAPVTAPGSRFKAAITGGAFALLIGWFSFQWLVPGDEWEPYTPNTLAQLRDGGTTVLVDFTADS